MEDLSNGYRLFLPHSLKMSVLCLLTSMVVNKKSTRILIPLKDCLCLSFYKHTHTHTHTRVGVYIYIFLAAFTIFIILSVFGLSF